VRSRPLPWKILVDLIEGARVGRRDVANYQQHFWLTLYPSAGPAALQGGIVSSVALIDDRN
jgi:hypothetical protein